MFLSKRSFFFLGFVLVASGALWGCTCQRKNQKVKKKKSIRTPQAHPSRPLISLKAEMIEIMKITKELRRRAEAGAPLTSPVRMLKQKSQGIPLRSFPLPFKALNESWQKRIKQLERTKEHRKDFNQMLGACVSCHATYAKLKVEQVKALKIP